MAPRSSSSDSPADSETEKPAAQPSAAAQSEFVEKTPTTFGTSSTDQKLELTEEDVYDELGYSWPSWKKWGVLTIIFLVQVSMVRNPSLLEPRGPPTHPRPTELQHLSLQQ